MGGAQGQQISSAQNVMAAPRSAKYWGPQTGIDYPGNDLKTYPSSNPDLCAELCDGNAQCVGYIVASDSQNCWTKSKFENPTPSNARLARVKPGQPVPPGLPAVDQVKVGGSAPSVNGYQLQQFTDHPNSAVVGNTTSKDPNICAQACNTNPQCTGFIQSTDNPYCWLTSSMTAGQPSFVRNTYTIQGTNPALVAQQAAAKQAAELAAKQAADAAAAQLAAQKAQQVAAQQAAAARDAQAAAAAAAAKQAADKAAAAAAQQAAAAQVAQQAAAAQAAAAKAPAPAPMAFAPSPMAFAPSPMSAAPVMSSTGSVYSTFPNKDCYDASYDRGYQGVKSQAAIEAICDANPKCNGAVQHSGGDWWLLEQVNAPSTNSPGNMCIQKSKETMSPSPKSFAPAPARAAPAPMGSAAALAHSPVHTAPKYEHVTPKQTEHCLETLRKCVAAAPDGGSAAPSPAHSPSTGTSHYQAYGGAPFGEPASTGSNIMKIFLAFLVIMFAMLMAAKQ